MGLTVNYAVVLGLFWMTAPLAWAYGVPFERWMPRERAVRFRLWTLALVSAWRVLLMIRVLGVLFHMGWMAASLFVLVFGSFVALIAIRASRPRRPTAVPMVVTGMGGISPVGRRELQTVQHVTGCLVPLLWLTLCIGLPTLLFAVHDSTPIQFAEATLPRESASTGLFALATGAVAFWGFLLPREQRRQRRRTQIDDLIRSGQLQQAVGELRSLAADQLPDQWLPPLQDVLSGGTCKPLLDWMDAAATLPADHWARRATDRLFADFLRDPVL